MSEELTILLPYFNEQGWLGRTIDSLAKQRDERFCIILIDNASTDGGDVEARRHARGFGTRARFLRVPEPGKTQALAAGLRLVRTPYTATCDADTVYPQDYVANILALFKSHESAAAVFAIDLYADASGSSSKLRIDRILAKANRRPRHCHAGGYAQAFRTELLRAAGGFDAARWGFVLEDHEIAYRMLQFGSTQYAKHHYCYPSPRRKSRNRVSWTRFERMVYRLTPWPLMDWFFYSFLARRLLMRGSHAEVLREKSWDHSVL